jgi:hypothetical protein
VPDLTGTVHRLTPKKVAAFIYSLRAGLSVSHAARLSGFARRTWYDRRAADPDLAAAWDDACEEGADRLEDEALRRAVEGVRTEKIVTSQGRALKDDDGEYVKDVTIAYSDTLLIFLLKGRRPEKYADRHKVNVQIKQEAERLAASLGLDAADVLAEAERIVSGLS